MAPHPAYTIAGCSAPSVRAATSLKGCPPAGRCLQCTSSDAPSAQNTPLFVLRVPQNALLSTKHPTFCSEHPSKHPPQHKASQICAEICQVFWCFRGRCPVLWSDLPWFCALSWRICFVFFKPFSCKSKMYERNFQQGA